MKRSPRRLGLLLAGILLAAAGLLLPRALPAATFDPTALAYAQGGLFGIGLLLVLRALRA